MDHAHSESHPQVNYFFVFLALCVCTALSVVFDVVEMSPALLVFAVLAVAVAKASFVMTYFMHLKFEGRWKFIILMPTAILGVGLMVALAPDIAMHYYSYEVMQTEVEAHSGAYGEGHGHGEEDGHAAGHGSHADEEGHDDHGAEKDHAEH